VSFILDALKKSELERQRQSIPGLVDSGIMAPRARLPAWAIALAVLLAINLMVLLFVLTRGWLQSTHAAAVATVQTPTPPPTQAQRGAAPVVETTPSHFSPMDSQPTYAPEIPVAPAPETPTSPPKSESAGSSGSHTIRRADPLLSDESSKSSDYQAENDEVLPTVNEISLSGAQALPELHLDVHVYATRPADRFVYVNMRKYHEGATLEEGPTVERIRRDGVVLNYQGLRFLLPRQ
jgi:general secretion pathway protein B